MIPLILFIAITYAHATPELMYHKYPYGIVPAGGTDDFSILNAAMLIPEREKEIVLETYQYNSNFHGFIFDDHGIVQKIISKIRTVNFTNDIGQLTFEENSFFYERMGARHDNTIYMISFYDYDGPYFDKQRHARCLISKEDAKLDLETFCDVTPRCMGYIDNVCAVTSVDRDKPFVDVEGVVYYEKRRYHRVINTIVQEHTVLFLSVYFAIVTVLTVGPYAANTRLWKKTKKEKSSSSIY